MLNAQIKAIFLASGFKEKDQGRGVMDLNPYVYEAARALLGAYSQELEHFKAANRELSEANVARRNECDRLRRACEKEFASVQLLDAECATLRHDNEALRLQAGGMQMELDELRVQLADADEKIGVLREQKEILTKGGGELAMERDNLRDQLVMMTLYRDNAVKKLNRACEALTEVEKERDRLKAEDEVLEQTIDRLFFAYSSLREQMGEPCKVCKGYGRYQAGDSGTDADGRCPNIVECDCADCERLPAYRACPA